jgi:hypothetical protein
MNHYKFFEYVSDIDNKISTKESIDAAEALKKYTDKDIIQDFNKLLVTIANQCELIDYYRTIQEHILDIIKANNTYFNDLIAKAKAVATTSEKNEPTIEYLQNNLEIINTVAEIKEIKDIPEQLGELIIDQEEVEKCKTINTYQKSVLKSLLNNAKQLCKLDPTCNICIDVTVNTTKIEEQTTIKSDIRYLIYKDGDDKKWLETNIRQLSDDVIKELITADTLSIVPILDNVDTTVILNNCLIYNNNYYDSKKYPTYGYIKYYNTFDKDNTYAINTVEKVFDLSDNREDNKDKINAINTMLNFDVPQLKPLKAYIMVSEDFEGEGGSGPRKKLCKNATGTKVYYTGKESSPLGRGYSAVVEASGKKRKGKDGNLYVVHEKRNGDKIWKKVKK